MGTCKACDGKGDEVLHDWKPEWKGGAGCRIIRTCSACGGSGRIEDHRYCDDCGSKMWKGTSGTWHCEKCDHWGRAYD